jgi:tetratricopeptide (TPR) repeat protein
MMRGLGVLVAIAAVALIVAAVAAHEAPAPITGAMPAFSERANRDVQIKVWNEALAADTSSAIALGQLAGLHLQRAREGGAWDDYLKAEEYARRSLALRTTRNGKTAAALANILLAQHRFADAQEVAAQLVRRESDVPQYRALLGEISMELGDYKIAAWMFDSLWAQRAHLSIAPRLARWAELNGQLAQARRLIEAARDEARTRADVPQETRAWFELREGELAMRMGRVRAAEAAFRAGLAIEPNDPRLLGAMARLSAVRGKHSAAISWGERSLAVQLDADVLALMSTAYAALGDTARAAEFSAAMEAAISQQPGPFHRSWTLHLLEHDPVDPGLLSRAQQEFETRKDIYGADVLAWALHRSGRSAAADGYMAQALRLGTPDAMLWYHDGMIALAIGDRPRAKKSLQRALEVNPYFHPSAPARVRAVVDSLRS